MFQLIYFQALISILLKLLILKDATGTRSLWITCEKRKRKKIRQERQCERMRLLKAAKRKSVDIENIVEEEICLQSDFPSFVISSVIICQ